DAKQRTASTRAFDDFFRDWRAGDLPELHEAYRRYSEQSTRAHGEALMQALDEGQSRMPAVEMVWQDIGGGTSQIARYIAARYETSPESIGIDLLFGGGTDI